MAKAPDALRAPEVAERLGLRGRDVYRLIFSGELDGRPDSDGIVRVSKASVESYLEAHGHENRSYSGDDPKVTGPGPDRNPR